MPVASSPGSATSRTEPSHRRGARAHRLDVTLLAGATAVGLWLGIAAPGVSPVAAPVVTAAPTAVAQAVQSEAAAQPPTQTQPETRPQIQTPIQDDGTQAGGGQPDGRGPQGGGGR